MKMDGAVGRLAFAAVMLSASSPPVSAQEYPAAPTAAEVLEVSAALRTMKAEERGPFLRIRWYCADGTVHAPAGTPCRERGGGVQHAEHGPLALRLRALGYNVGTILQATTDTEFADAARAGYRLREMVLERYLFGVDDGWVMRRARFYRGALQIEDEERSGRALLERRLSDGDWVRANYFLATRVAAALPHARASGSGTLDRIRSTATEIANADPGFMRLRVKIHSLPSLDDAGSVDAYLAGGTHTSELRAKLVQLRDDLRRKYDPLAALDALAAYERRLAADLGGDLAALRRVLAEGDAGRSFGAIAELAPRLRALAERGGSGSRTLDVIDLNASLQERAFVLAEDLARTAPAATRVDALSRYNQYVALAYGAGYLSRREHDALVAESRALAGRSETTALEYKAAFGYLGRSLDWARGSVRGTFAPVLDRYVPVEPVAAGLPDALLRGSVLLPLSNLLDDLHTDADAVLGASHSIFGNTVSRGVRGLNPGVALRTLRVLEPGHYDDFDARTIYVLPETPPELKPVAGVLTLAEGNLLSHVQLLARNLGIPNATLAPEMSDRLLPADGREVFYAVSPLGRVVLQWPDQLTAEERAIVESGQPASGTERFRLDTSRLRLDARRPIPLSALRSTDSGILVGPKAANLGQLAADFPGRVSAAIALPFGVFYEHADRRYGGSERTVLEELRAAFQESTRMRAAGASDADVDAYMFPRLTWVRDAIQGLEWIPELRTQVVEATLEMLDGDMSRGVFVRSDTNVEDLPQFSGAGLNLTVAHQTSIDDVLAAVKRVWTSPFSERAYLWRSQILEEQGEVYPSVLLQETIPSEKSGVLITSGLQEGGPDDLTVVAAEGVGGAVDGEDAETLILTERGGVRLLTQSKAPRRRQVVRGGTRWVAATLPEELLRPGEIDQLREVVTAWQAEKAGTPEEDTTWDIEYGFVDGWLWLFQVRPFIRFRNSDLYRRLEALDAGTLANAGRRVRLSAPLEAS